MFITTDTEIITTKVMARFVMEIKVSDRNPLQTQV